MMPADEKKSWKKAFEVVGCLNGVSASEAREILDFAMAIIGRTTRLDLHSEAFISEVAEFERNSAS